MVSLEIIKAPESAFMFLIYPLKQRRITTKNTGTKKIASNVAETIPPIPTHCVLRATAGTVTDS